MKWALEFPLLRRQALELSQHRRLWWVRSLLVLVQIIIILPFYASTIGDSGFDALGQGAGLAQVLLVCNLVTIYLLLPVSASATIASERVRQTLPLLLISRISPAKLVWEKFLWSLQLVFSAILVSLPVMAISYALGGLSAAQLAVSVLLMTLAALQVNSVAIFWSSLVSSPLQAFWGTLFTLLLLLLGPVLLGVAQVWPFQQTILGELPMWMLFTAFWRLADSVFPALGFSSADIVVTLLIIAAPLSLSLLLLLASGFVVSRWRWEAPLVLLKRSIREALTPRNSDAAIDHPPTPRPGRTPTATKMAVDVNATLEAPPAAELPAAATTAHRPATTGAGQRDPAAKFRWPPDQPLAARECSGSITCRTRTHVVLSVVLVILVWLMVTSELRVTPIGASVVLQICLLLLGVLQVQSLAARAIVAERERETLAVLLTVPLTSTRIVQQKLAAAARFRNLLMLPFGVLVLLSMLSGSGFSVWGNFWVIEKQYDAPFAQLLVLVIYWQHLTLALRVGGLCSLITRSTLKATASALGILFGYCLLHLVGVFFLEVLRGPADALGLTGFAPLVGLVWILDDGMSRTLSGDAAETVIFFVGLGAMGLFLRVLRAVTDRNAGRWLERPD
jgi:ABC-type transport system involved in multi-copper enzyme maturation permease subunit